MSRVARLTKDINYKFGDYNQMTCLHKAVSYGPDVLPFADCLSMVHSILAHESCDINALDEDGATPVHLAASSDGCSAAVEVLLDAGESSHTVCMCMGGHEATQERVGGLMGAAAASPCSTTTD